MNNQAEMPRPIGWRRAFVESVAILAVGAVVVVLVPNWALSELTGASRNVRVAIATVGWLTMLALLAWVLRRLQARRLI